MKPRQIAQGAVLAGLAVLIYAAAQPLIRTRQTALCQTNLKQIRQAAWIYIRDYDEKFPLARNWNDALHPYVAGFGPSKRSAAQIEQLYLCPASDNAYAYNPALARQRVTRVPSKTPFFFDTRTSGPQPNLSDTGHLWPLAFTHQARGKAGNNVLFVDGHVELIPTKPRFVAFPPLPQPTPTPRPKIAPRSKK